MKILHNLQIQVFSFHDFIFCLNLASASESLISDTKLRGEREGGERERGREGEREPRCSKRAMMTNARKKGSVRRIPAGIFLRGILMRNKRVHTWLVRICLDTLGHFNRRPFVIVRTNTYLILSESGCLDREWVGAVSYISLNKFSRTDDSVANFIQETCSHLFDILHPLKIEEKFMSGFFKKQLKIYLKG